MRSSSKRRELLGLVSESGGTACLDPGPWVISKQLVAQVVLCILCRAQGILVEGLGPAGRCGAGGMEIGR